MYLHLFWVYDHSFCITLFSQGFQFSLLSCIRFFCPPPSVYLVGKGWDLKRKEYEKRKSEGTLPKSGPGVFKPCCFVGIGNHDQEMQHLSLEDKV